MFHSVLKSENLAKYLGLSGSEDTNDLIFVEAFPNSSPRSADATQTIAEVCPWELKDLVP